MAVKTYSEQLEDVQTAIAAIEGGSQEYTIGGAVSRSVKRGDLDTLYAREKWLRKMSAREDRGGGIRIRGATKV